MSNLSKNKPRVSVCVITYNQDQYISKCLESIVGQKCNFDFELIIRDDCSQDKTLKIIKEFKDKYPKIIKIIEANENIGANKNLLSVFAESKGEYLAICEGDDYWLDDYKLQKQVEIMDGNEDVSFVAHPCWIHDKNRLRNISFVKSMKVIKINCSDVLNVPGQFAPTASYMFKRELLEKLPIWFKDAPVGDFFIEMYALAMGQGRYFPDAMSAYRTYSLNSWSVSISNSKLVSFSRLMLDCLQKMQKEESFSKLDFSKKIGKVYFNIAIGSLLMKKYSDYQTAIINCRTVQKNIPLRQGGFYYFRNFPSLVNFILKIKLQLRS